MNPDVMTRKFQDVLSLTIADPEDFDGHAMGMYQLDQECETAEDVYAVFMAFAVSGRAALEKIFGPESMPDLDQGRSLNLSISRNSPEMSECAWAQDFALRFLITYANRQEEADSILRARFRSVYGEDGSSGKYALVELAMLHEVASWFRLSLEDQANRRKG